MRLIDADALVELFREVIGGIARQQEMNGNLEHMVRASAMVIEMIEDAPTIEPEQKTGKWEPDTTGWEFCCSECGYSVMFGGEANTFKYCPECGAKMEETE